MFRRLAVIGALATGLIALTSAAPARAQTFDKITDLTFSKSVQVPWATLSAGTYRFRLTDGTSTRKVLQVLSGDGAVVYSMFHTTPDFRLTATDEPVVTFKETPADTPPVIQSLFYGGENDGYEFVYPDRIPLVAFERPQPPVTYSPIPVTAAPVEAVAMAEPAPPAIEPVEATPAAEPAEVELPKTASPLPLVALFGFSALLAGLSVRVLRRRLN